MAPADGGGCERGEGEESARAAKTFLSRSSGGVLVGHEGGVVCGNLRADQRPKPGAATVRSTNGHFHCIILLKAGRHQADM